MDNDNVVYICQERPCLFTLGEVNKLVPLLIRITKKHETRIQDALDRQKYLIKTGASVIAIQEQDNIVSREMTSWGSKVFKLGAKVMQDGYLGFDSGSFYWSFHYGDTACTHYHEYLETPLARRIVSVVKL